MSAAKKTSRKIVQPVAKNLHRRGNSYEFRKIIPPYARAAFDGKGAYWRSFGAVSLREAEHFAEECRRHCDRLIASAANRPDPTARVGSFKVASRVPSKEEIDRAVRAWVSEREQNGESALDRETARQRVKDLQQIADITPVHLRERRTASLLETRWVADSITEKHGWYLPSDDGLADYLHDRVGRAQREAALRLKAEHNFEDRPTPTHAMFETAAFARDLEEPTKPIRVYEPIMEIFDGYLAERKPVGKTVKKWRTALTSLIRHLGHDDAARVTPADIIAWKNALLLPVDGRDPRSPGTVRNGYIGAAKPVFGWALENRKIKSNPAAGITVRVPRRVTNRTERGYTPAEAKKVLRAASATPCDDGDAYGLFARRWLPWLLAYTGARATEIAQLRRSDILESEEGIWHLTIRPDAGSQKSGRARSVPLHPHLIEQGFVQAIKARTGPLFYEATRRDAKSSGNSQAQKAAQRVAEWVREIGVDDDELQPNHGWRHAFISNARGSIDGDVRRAIVGHSGKDEHDEYGNVSLRIMNQAMQRFPRYDT